MSSRETSISATPHLTTLCTNFCNSIAIQLAAALRSIYEAKGLSDPDILIAIDEGVLIVSMEATAALAAALAAASAAAPKNVRSQSDESSDDEDPKEVIGMGHASNSGEDLPKWNWSESKFEGFDDQGEVGRWVSRGWWDVGQGLGREGV